VTWLAPFVFGIWLGRQDLRHRRLRRRLVGLGAATAVAAFIFSKAAISMIEARVWIDSPFYLLTSGAHGQMPLWLIGGTGAAVFVLGVALIAADAFPRLTWPLAATGQLALTVYVGHLLVIHAASGLARSESLRGALVLVAFFTLTFVAGATAWRATLGRGPLEWALTPPARLRWPLARRSEARSLVGD
jgi:uncharacterized membrane protein YeiB